MLAQRLLSDPQTAIAIGSKERPLLAGSRRCSRMTDSDPTRPFSIGGTKVSNRIAKRSFDCHEQLGS